MNLLDIVRSLNEVGRRRPITNARWPNSNELRTIVVAALLQRESLTRSILASQPSVLSTIFAFFLPLRLLKSVDIQSERSRSKYLARLESRAKADVPASIPIGRRRSEFFQPPSLKSKIDPVSWFLDVIVPGDGEVANVRQINILDSVVSSASIDDLDLLPQSQDDAALALSFNHLLHGKGAPAIEQRIAVGLCRFLLPRQLISRLRIAVVRARSELPDDVALLVEKLSYLAGDYDLIGTLITVRDSDGPVPSEHILSHNVLTVQNESIQPLLLPQGADTLTLVQGNVPLPLLRNIIDRSADAAILRLHAGSLNKFSKDQVAEAVSIDAGVILDVRDQFVPAYGQLEQALCDATKALSVEMASTLANIVKEASYPDVAALLEQIEICFDDILFSRAVPLIGALAAILQYPHREIVLVVDSVEFATSLMEFVRGAAGRRNIHLIGTPGCVLDPTLLYGSGPPADVPIGDEMLPLVAREVGALVALGARLTPKLPANVSTLFVGRPLDRNHQHDIGALAEASRARRPVVLLPSAMPTRRSIDNARTLREGAGDIFDWVVFEPFEASRSNYGPIAPIIASRAFNHTVATFRESFSAYPLKSNVFFAAEPALRRLINRLLPGFIVAASILQELFSRNPPAYVVAAPGRDWLSRMAIVAAKQRGLPTFDVQVAFLGPRGRYRATLADRQTAIDTTAADLFRSYFRLTPEQIMLTGCVKIGNLRREVLALQRNHQGRVAMPEKNRIILFAASPQYAACAPVFQALVEACAQIEGAEARVKLHPSSDDSQEVGYREILNAAGRKGQVLGKGNLAAAIASADIVVTRFSNVGLESALVDKPVIACAFSDVELAVRLDEMGVASLASTPQELFLLIQNFLENGTHFQALEISRAQYVQRNKQLIVENPAQYLLAAIEDEAGRLGAKRLLDVPQNGISYQPPEVSDNVWQTLEREMQAAPSIPSGNKTMVALK